MSVQVLFRIDIGFDPERCYAASIIDAQENKVKGIKGNSIQQLMGRVRHAIIDEMEKKRHFPLEHEREPSRIIMP